LGKRPAVVSLLPLFGIPTMVGQQGEDCLVLNIWTRGLRSGGRPVLVWLHGGMDFGAGDWPRFDGAALARAGDLVVVTLNHRLGLFGHLHLGWTGDPAYADSGNAGLLDLTFALDWLRRNVSGFGGDPGNITVAGGSRGASRLASLLSLTAPTPPFRRAVLMSPPRALRVPRVPPEEAAEAVLRRLGVPTAEPHLLADVPMDLLRSAQAWSRRHLRHVFQPSVDGVPVELRCYGDAAAGVAAHVPVMIGTTVNETARMLDATPDSWDGVDDAELTRRCCRVARYDVSDLVAEYRRARPNDPPRRIAIAVTTDALYRFPALALASARGRTSPTYAYVFAGGTGSHSEDVLYFFDNLGCAAMVSRGPASRRLAEQASGAWISFCRDGVPTVPGVGTWPTYTAADRRVMIFGNPTRVVADPFAATRARWDHWVPTVPVPRADPAFARVHAGNA
jgi:para-nitrobenzyl esterase